MTLTQCCLSPDTQRALFFDLAEIWSPTSDREWFDLYFTSFFSVWLDYQRRYGQKKYVAGFASMLALEPREHGAISSGLSRWLAHQHRPRALWLVCLCQASRADGRKDQAIGEEAPLWRV